jgi:hypothetical protein
MDVESALIALIAKNAPIIFIYITSFAILVGIIVRAVSIILDVDLAILLSLQGFVFLVIT